MIEHPSFSIDSNIIWVTMHNLFDDYYQNFNFSQNTLQGPPLIF